MKVVVVGAGQAGLSAARELQRAGTEHMLVRPRFDFTDRACAVVQHLASDSLAYSN